uniref:Uncharacterized protein n=1 Tax=Arundo donax TaxID=35708 RepID=A0A0A9A6M5_ARUDO
MYASGINHKQDSYVPMTLKKQNGHIQKEKLTMGKTMSPHIEFKRLVEYFC